MNIYAERDSVCMGDDVTAPNEADLETNDQMLLSAFMASVAEYVPEMEDVIWTVHEKNRRGSVIALLISAEGSRTYSVALQRKDCPMKNAGFDSIFCRYFYPDMLDLKEIGGNLSFKEKVLKFISQEQERKTG